VENAYLRLDPPTAGQRLTSRQRQAAARREQILKASLKMFAAQGFDATSRPRWPLAGSPPCAGMASSSPRWRLGLLPAPGP